MTDPLDQIRQTVIGYYRANAVKRFDRYEEQPAGDHCRYCLKYMAPAGSVLDIGSGSGRDAAFFASNGYQVSAVEPATELRELAQQKHVNNLITWADDYLPELKGFSDVSEHYDHVHLSAVIFHLPQSETRKILERIFSLLKKDGTVFIGLRIGPADPERPMFNLDSDWIISQSTDLFEIINIEESEDDFKRDDIRWSRMILKKI